MRVQQPIEWRTHGGDPRRDRNEGVHRDVLHLPRREDRVAAQLRLLPAVRDLIVRDGLNYDHKAPPHSLKTLDQITAGDRRSIGSKACNCARLKQAGFPVPDGIAIPNDVAAGDLRALPSDPWFDALPAGTRFAVRSSGRGEDSEGHSFAGVHDTQLNVGRAELTEAIVLCRRSATSDQARAYRDARQVADGDIAIGVLVQCMVPAIVSGVAFTINPITGAGEIVINAAWGLGEALVNGRVDPDEFTLSKRDHHVMVERLGAKHGEGAGPTLSPDQLRELGDLLRRIEQHYGAPQDIEWCHDGRQFWIVQARPVTTAPRAELRTENFELRTENLERRTQNAVPGTTNVEPRT